MSEFPPPNFPHPTLPHFTVDKYSKTFLDILVPLHSQTFVDSQMAIRKTRLQSYYRKGLGRGNSGEYGTKFRAKPRASRRRLRRRRRPVTRARSRNLLLRRTDRQMQDFDGLYGRRALPSTHQEAKALFHPSLPRTSQTGVIEDDFTQVCIFID